MEVVASWPSSSPLSGVVDWAQRAEALGFDVMHVPETIHDPFTVAALALEMFGLDELGDALSQMAHRSDWDDLHRHLSDEVIQQLVPHGTYDTLPDVLSEWYSGLCDGIVLTIPDDAESTTFRTLVERCQAIAPRAEA